MEIADKTIKLKVTGMSCGGCVNTVRKALEGIDGVISATVDLDSGSAEVKIGRDDLDPGQLKSAITTVGYGVEIIG